MTSVTKKHCIVLPDPLSGSGLLRFVLTCLTLTKGDAS